MTDMDPAERVGRLNDILHAMLDDLFSNGLRPLEDYQAMAPELAEAIAELLPDPVPPIVVNQGLQIGSSADLKDSQNALGLDQQVLGPYRIIKLIGRGGQGIVYLAEDSRLRRKVALKVLLDNGPGSEALLLRFRREAELGSSIEHPGICGVHDVGIDRGIPYIAMRYVEGETLARKIATARSQNQINTTSVGEDKTSETNGMPSGEQTPSTGPKTEREIHAVLLLIENAARSLHVAHEAKIIHRDIKPGNIMVTPDGSPVILDFGIARDSEGVGSTLTQPGEPMGTPAYMSPEVIRADPREVDLRADIYSLGVTLIECLTLRRPFDAPTREQLYRSIQDHAPPDPRRLNPAISRDLQIVLLTAIEKDRDRRYQTALAFAEDLRRVRQREPIKARPVPAWRRGWRWYQRNRALGITLTSAFLILSVALGKLLSLVFERDSALHRYEQMSDASLLEDLKSRQGELWPRRSHVSAAMARWLSEARVLLTRIEGHQSALNDLRRFALPNVDAEREENAARRRAYPALYDEIEGLRIQQKLRRIFIESRSRELLDLKTAFGGSQSPRESERVQKEIKAKKSEIENDQQSLANIESSLIRVEANPHLRERLVFKFTRVDHRWQHEVLSKIVRDLPELHGLILDVQNRLDTAKEVQRVTMEMEEARRAWSRCIADVSRKDSRYQGLHLDPVEGLVPLGIDSESRLWEFWHVESGDRPVFVSTRDGTDPNQSEYVGRVSLEENSGIVLVLLPGGTFWMGSTQDPGKRNADPESVELERPVHSVQLSPFFIAKCEVTQRQWLRLMGSNPSQRKMGAEDGRELGAAITARHPVEQVSWVDASEACRRWGVALPTEAQWEYACRAETESAWWCGDDVESIGVRRAGNIADEAALSLGFRNCTLSLNDGFLVHAPIGTFAANRFGLHDVIGNVKEWCQDSLGAYIVPSQDDPNSGDIPCDYGQLNRRILRGGSFATPANECRSAFRGTRSSTSREIDYGLRVALPLRPADARN